MNIEEIYNQSFQYIYRYFYYNSINPSDIEDLCHEVFIRFYQKYQNEQIDTSEAKRILYGFAKNIYKEWCRKSYKEHKVEFVENLTPDDVDDYDDFIDEEYEEEHDKQRKQILDAMQNLNPRVKYVLEARFLHNKTRKEIATELGISEKDVHTYQKRGVKYLSKMINGSAILLKSLIL